MHEESSAIPLMSSRFTSPKSAFLPQLHHREDEPGIALAGPVVINSPVGFMICHWSAEALGNCCNLSNLHCSTTLRTSNTLYSNFKIYRKAILTPSQVSPTAFFVPSILLQHPFKLCFFCFSVLLPATANPFTRVNSFNQFHYLAAAFQILLRLKGIKGQPHFTPCASCLTRS